MGTKPTPQDRQRPASSARPPPVSLAAVPNKPARQTNCGDRAANQLVVRNVFSNTVKVSYQLSSAPNRILLDVTRRLAIVSFGGGTTSLAKVDLETGKVSALPLLGPAKDIALSGSGQVLALTGTDEYWAQQLEIIEEHSGASWKVMAKGITSFGNVLAYRPAGAVLFMTSAGLSPGELSRFTLDWEARTVTALGSTRDNGSQLLRAGAVRGRRPPGCPLRLGQRVRLQHLRSRHRQPDHGHGRVDHRPLPRGCRLQPRRQVPGRQRHQDHPDLLRHHPRRLSSFDIPDCAYSNTGRVRVSLDSAFAFALTQCGFMADSAALTWNHVP